MAAEVVAGELGLPLFRIELAGIVSKWIGETEKNLDRIFEAAAESNAILFFDEADALFGKRSEVKDSHDRYANLEVSYLLQKMEGYEGVAILATNMRHQMDDAFLRRLTFTVIFPMPEAGDRARIWAAVWPPELPRGEDVDFDLLGRIKLTGGNIKNVVLAAAHLAAGKAEAVSMADLRHAIRREYQKLGKQMEPREIEALLEK
jgi:SpoVK/Ycf46/Vps4 family AAA+-type ATPase